MVPSVLVQYLMIAKRINEQMGFQFLHRTGKNRIVKERERGTKGKKNKIKFLANLTSGNFHCLNIHTHTYSTITYHTYYLIRNS